MPDYPGEVAGLPEGGPATVAAVKVWLDIDHNNEDERLGMIVAAVNSQVRTWRVAGKSADREQWIASTALGANMLAARIDRRRSSPDGVSAFDDQGPVYVQRNDPDIGRLLELGPNAEPAVG